ncbi:hypothetical protein [Brevundimonas sp.]|uniref:hypothetical protein n=1 Tax=Brevundimonas sp. TaxID=1871086 RepID=UPI002D3B22BE|nr:hypothetical protein [Brevundimonas sp.]HYC67881.1 hypothetical protein [Brevundimonas sp.]
MIFDIQQLAVGASWVASAIGLSLWLWSWFREKDAVRRVRLLDCGLVLIASAVLLRIVAQEKPMGVMDWALAILAPLFIAAALWRLARTACPPTGQ